MLVLLWIEHVIVVLVTEGVLSGSFDIMGGNNTRSKVRSEGEIFFPEEIAGVGVHSRCGGPSEAISPNC